jgi:N-acetyl-gamma-glutamylphosphate reductase
MSLLPALIKATKPAFIANQLTSSEQSIMNIQDVNIPNMNTPSMNKTAKPNYARALRSLALITLIASASYFAFNQQAHATSTEEARDIVNKVNNVDDGKQVTRKLTMTMIDKRGKTRVRETQAYRKYYEQEKRTVLFYKKPTNVFNL